jgi:hypothetical protein
MAKTPDPTPKTRRRINLSKSKGCTLKERGGARNIDDESLAKAVPLYTPLIG